MSQERLPKDEWSRSNRLEKLNNAISEISTPVLAEGRSLLNQVGLSTPGAEAVKENMAEIQVVVHLLASFRLHHCKKEEKYILLFILDTASKN